MITCIPFIAYEQSFEAAVKDLTLCKIQNRYEITRSFMESTRSYFAPNAKDSLQEDKDFMDRKRTNEDTREFYGTKLFNKNLLVQFCSVFPPEINQEECDYCCAIIGKVDYIKEARTSDMVYDVTSSAPKEDNATVRKAGLYFVLPLEGNIQFDKLGTMHDNHVMNELRLHNAFALVAFVHWLLRLKKASVQDGVI